MFAGLEALGIRFVIHAFIAAIALAILAVLIVRQRRAERLAEAKEEQDARNVKIVDDHMIIGTRREKYDSKPIVMDLKARVLLQKLEQQEREGIDVRVDDL